MEYPGKQWSACLLQGENNVHKYLNILMIDLIINILIMYINILGQIMTAGKRKRMHGGNAKARLHPHCHRSLST